MQQFDIIIIGGGHSGCEAAAVAARMGARVALVTMRPDNIGAMSCNPSIGGVGKGHLVRELDVFDGLMARAADHAAIHYRMLNASKGAAVQGPRIQADRKRYRHAIQAMLSWQAGIDIVVGAVERLSIADGRVDGVVLADGSGLAAAAVILAAGTFLGGLLHSGLTSRPGGRVDEGAATALSCQLRDHGLPIARLKTGTPPRLDGRTIDWAALAPQYSDLTPWRFSPLGAGRVAPQLACAITRTDAATHDIIRRNLDRSPLHIGVIEGRGPRYCPSIEDKVARFGDRDGHQIFLEPEGLDDRLIYPNGISTSLPADVQQDMVRSIAGLERAEIVQPGYAVEYDHVDPRCLDHELAVRTLPGLYLAGQVNGTTGYEEAAAQGLVAGLAAAAQVLGRAPVWFDRSDSYIGVMIDDLVLQGVTEPYRMLTARAEYRLRLRADNATTRLGEAALASAAIGFERAAYLERYLADHRAATALFDRKYAAADLAEAGIVLSRGDDRTATLGDLVRQQIIVSPAHVAALAPHLAATPMLIDELFEDARYAPYVSRQAQDIARVRADAAISLDAIGDYGTIGGLSNEMVERLQSARPGDLAAAGRIRGITPAALAAILVQARKAHHAAR